MALDKQEETVRESRYFTALKAINTERGEGSRVASGVSRSRSRRLAAPGAEARSPAAPSQAPRPALPRGRAADRTAPSAAGPSRPLPSSRRPGALQMQREAAFRPGHCHPLRIMGSVDQEEPNAHKVVSPHSGIYPDDVPDYGPKPYSPLASFPGEPPGRFGEPDRVGPPNFLSPAKPAGASGLSPRIEITPSHELMQAGGSLRARDCALIPVTASLPPLEWPLSNQSGSYELQIEVQPKPHHRAHYETEGSRGAVKAPTGGHPVVQAEERCPVGGRAGVEADGGPAHAQADDVHSSARQHAPRWVERLREVTCPSSGGSGQYSPGDGF
ncbi:nuclear factor of activated T-cells, cytoplasmic 2-like [Marmota marmota marmota]|uniref:nuclear factor of activated T-cells, cytoplasmic 2-like n=1 Tax=Marmota marmota marmota TaxID=9994 RepID=UPI0020938A04|nr:nuclear factor of activated T-cells, cytoplasmic 2-like [Marmota marmota marmota]